MKKKSTELSKQAEAPREGAKFETYVKNKLNMNSILIQQKIGIFDNKDLVSDLDLKKRLTIKLRDYRPTGNNLFLIAKNLETKDPIAIICCKLSLHGRITETLFYSLFYKTYLQGPLMRVVLVTPDKGRQEKPGIWKSEWGSYDYPSKSRVLAEKFLDFVYIDNDYLKQINSPFGITELDGNMQNFSELITDLVKWKTELTK
jgi:hypothetical protein